MKGALLGVVVTATVGVVVASGVGAARMGAGLAPPDATLIEHPTPGANYLPPWRQLDVTTPGWLVDVQLLAMRTSSVSAFVRQRVRSVHRSPRHPAVLVG